MYLNHIPSKWIDILTLSNDRRSTTSKKRTKVRSLSHILETFKDPTLKEFVNVYKNVISKDQKEQIINAISDKDTIFEVPPLDKFHPPKNPIVLCHGLSGFDKLLLVPLSGHFLQTLTNNIMINGFDFSMDDSPMKSEAENIKYALIEVQYWHGIQAMLESRGCTVLTAKVPSFGSIEMRAKALNEYIEKEVTTSNKKSESTGSKEIASTKLNLISHSMGGLDSRYLISNIPSDKYKVVSLTTVATPHRGSEVADFVVSKFNSIRMNTVLKESGVLLPRSIYQLTTYYMKYFNNITPDRPDVKYFSYGCYFNPSWYNLFYTTWDIIDVTTQGELNDGMVSIPSSKWGEYRGTLANTDHMDIINWRNTIKLEMTQLIDHIEEEKKLKVKSRIDPLQFYLMIADDLGKRGF